MRHYLSILLYLFSFFKFKAFGKNIHLSLGGKFVRPEEISVGSNVFINSNFHISARNLTFGNEIMIGPNFVIECDDHEYRTIGMSMFSYRKNRIGSFVTIENDVWIGANVTILKNVTIGEGSVIGAGSVVTKDIPPYSICVGVPCKAIKSRFNQFELIKHLELIKSKKAAHHIFNSWTLNNIS